MRYNYGSCITVFNASGFNILNNDLLFNYRRATFFKDSKRKMTFNYN